MTLLTGWPALTEDSGNGTSGTILSKTGVFDVIKAAIEALIHSTTNPTVTPEDIIDEVVTARGNLASIDARISAVVDDDGVPVLPASAATQSQLAYQLGSVNWVPNSDFLIWTLGDSAAPDYWTLSGSGAAVARAGTGLGDTQRAKYGDFCAKITYGSAPAKLTQTLCPSGSFSRIDGIKLRKIAFGCWIKASVANQCSIVFDDGATQTRGGYQGNGTYHSGSGALVWCYGVHTVSSSATKLDVYVEVANAGTGYFGDVVVLLSDVALNDYAPTPMQKGTIHFGRAGTVATGTKYGVFSPGASGIVTDVQLRCETAPTGQALIVDVNTWDGAAFTSMFSTRPQIAAAGNQGNAAPDTTYARRCFKPIFSSTLAAGALISWDLDQIGSGTAGADLIVEVRVKQYIRALEPWLAYDAL